MEIGRGLLPFAFLVLATGCSPFLEKDHAVKEVEYIPCPEIIPDVERPKWPEGEPLFVAKLRYNILGDALDTVLDSIQKCHDRH